MKIKKGDSVVVIAGKDRSKSGTVLRVFRDKQLVVVEGLNMVKRHRKPTQQVRTGSIVEKPMPIHVSNVMIKDAKSGKGSRISIKRENGKRSRVARKSKEVIK